MQYVLNFTVEAKGDSLDCTYRFEACDDYDAREKARQYIADQQKKHNEQCAREMENRYFWWKLLSVDRVDGVRHIEREVLTRISV